LVEELGGWPIEPKQRSWKMRSPKKSIAAILLTVGCGLSLSACATEDYVDKHIATVNERISALEARVQQVDATAQSAAGAAQSANQRLDQLTARVDSIEQRLAQKPARN
jgi:murein lipoprotein